MWKKRSKFLKSVMTVGALAFVTRLVGFVFKIYLSRKMGAEAIGTFQIALSFFFLLLALSGSGLSITLSRRTAELSAVNAPIRPTVKATAFIAIMSAITVCFVVFVGQGMLKHVFSDVRCIPVLFMLLPTILSSAVYGTMRGYFLGAKRFTAYGVTELLEEAVKVVLTVVALSLPFFAGKDYLAVAAAFTVSDFIITAVMVIIYFRIMRSIGEKPCVSAPLSPLLRSSLPITCTRVSGNLLSTVIATSVPIMLVHVGMSVAEASAEIGRITGMALPILVSPLALTATLTIVLIPELATLNAKSHTMELRRKTLKALALSGVVGILGTVTFGLLGKIICNLLFGDVQAGVYLRAMSPACVFLSVNSMSVSVLNSLGYEKRTFASHIIGGTLGVCTVFVLTPLCGAYSIAASTIVTAAVGCALNLRGIRNALTDKETQKAAQPIRIVTKSAKTC